MEYVVTTWQPPHRVVFSGQGSGVVAVDDIRFEATPTGTRIDYTADIRLRGLLRLAAPFAGGAFARIGPGRTRRHAACARPPRDGGLTGHGHRDRRGGGQRPERSLGPARRPPSDRVRRRDRAWRARQDRDRRRDGRPGPGRHGLHRLQRTDLPAVCPAPRRARRRDPAERHVVRVVVRCVRDRLQLARRAGSSRMSARRPARRSGGCSPT